MKPYADANVLVQNFLFLPTSEYARTLLLTPNTGECEPVPVSWLLNIEFANALERMVFESRHGGQYRISPEYAAFAHASLENEIKSGIILREANLDVSAIAAKARQMILRHTSKHGFRTYDILHVASALELGCDTFWSFDKKALKLAKLEGLKTNHPPARA